VLFEEGLNQTTHGDLIFDEVSARTTKATFEDKGQDRLPFDYDHGMLGIVTTPDSGKAAGWFVPGTDGPLTANDIQWTPAAEEAIRNREFRFFSPAVRLVTGDTEDGPQRVHSLINVALTNLPATKNQKPMVASETMPGDTGATYEDTRDNMSTELLKLLGAKTEAEAITALSVRLQTDGALFEALGVQSIDQLLPAVQTLLATAASAGPLAEEVRQLTAKLADGEREQLITQLNDAGKLPEALHGWARTLDVASLKAFGESAPAHPKYEGGHDPKGEDALVLTDAHKEAAKQLGYTEAEYVEAVLADKKAEAEMRSGRVPSMRRAD
jgi:phage I-like protein